VRSTRAAMPRHRRRWSIAAWCIQFGLSLTSLDSVFFAYAWLVGWHFFETRRFDWRRYLLHALAPVLAQSLLFAQNAWYLGAKTMVDDVIKVLAEKSAARSDAPAGRGQVLTYLLPRHLGNYVGGLWGLAILLAAAWGPRLVPAKVRDLLLPTRLLVLLFAAGAAYPFLLPVAGHMPYQARQWGPFAAAASAGVVAGLALWGLAQAQALVRGLAIAVPLALSVGIVRHQLRVPGNPDYVAETMRARPSVALAKELAARSTRYEPVYFSGGGLDWVWDTKYDPRAPQIHPVVEVYAGRRPILCFRTQSVMAEDLGYMLAHAGARFSPVVTAPDEHVLRGIIEALAQQQLLTTNNVEVHAAAGASYADLTDAIAWDRFPSLR